MNYSYKKYGTNNQSQNKKIKNSKNGFILITFVVVVLVVGAIIIKFGLNKPELVPTGYVSFSYGFTDVKITDEKSVIKAIDSVSDVIGITDVEAELKVSNTYNVGKDTYYRLQQYYQGIPVYGKIIAVSADAKGKGTALTSNYVAFTEEIDTKPSVEQKNIDASVKAYFEDSEIIVPQVDESQVVIYCDSETNKQKLAYCLYVSSNKTMGNVIIDAKTGDVLAFTSYISSESASVTNKSGTITTPGWRNDDGSYHLYNDEYKISVFNMKKAENTDIREMDFRLYGIDTIYSKDNTFEDEAINVFKNAIDISDYYKELDFEGFDRMHIGYNEKYLCRNFVSIGGSTVVDGELHGLIQIGIQADINRVDLIAHEYTHAVSRSINNWKVRPSDPNEFDETGAIDEGYSDFFGELIDEYCWSLRAGREVEMDWIHGERIINDPQSNGYPDSIDDTNNSGEDYSHGYSTVISHAGFLMWNGNNDTSARIDSETLAELWYRALFLIQPDVNYVQFRNAMELSARIMIANGELESEEYETIQQAFDAVGIRDSESLTYNYIVNNEFDLTVLNHEETEDVSYNLRIFNGVYNDDFLIEERKKVSDRCTIDLENGIYVLEVFDSHNENDLSEKIIIKLVVDGNNENAVEEVTVYTEFTEIITIILDYKKPDDERENETTDTLTDAQLASFQKLLDDRVYDFVMRGTFENNVEQVVKVDIYNYFYESLPESTMFNYYFPGQFKSIESDPLNKVDFENYQECYEYDADKVLFILNDVYGLEVKEDYSNENCYFHNGKFYFYITPGGLGYLYEERLEIDSYELVSNGYFKINTIRTTTYDIGDGRPEVEKSTAYFIVKPAIHEKYGEYWKIKDFNMYGDNLEINENIETGDTRNDVTPDGVPVCYKEIINQYETVIQNNYYIDYYNGQGFSQASIGEYVNKDLLTYACEYRVTNYDVCYAIHDMNKDGVYEFVIGFGRGTAAGYRVDIYDIFTQKDDKPIRLTPVGGNDNGKSFSGKFKNFYLYDSGSIKTKRSSKTSGIYLWEYFYLPPGATQVEFQLGVMESPRDFCQTYGADGCVTGPHMDESAIMTLVAPMETSMAQLDWIKIIA